MTHDTLESNLKHALANGTAAVPQTIISYSTRYEISQHLVAEAAADVVDGLAGDVADIDVGIARELP